ncbi:MAG: hypothetical protein NC078_04805 [Ruminococcus sp.]|nr:hypothetical protein [Ruminococcus sp.]
MNPNRLYEILTETLADEDIRAEIVERIAAKAACDTLPGQTELFPGGDGMALAAENTELSRRLALCELENGRLQGEKAALIERIRSLQEAVSQYSSAYGMQIALHARFTELGEPAAGAMRGFFKNTSPSGLFFCGVQPDNLMAFRDYTERLVIEGDGAATAADILLLDDLYVYLLSCYNSTFTSPVYSLTAVKPGDEFDGSIHHNIGVAKSGRITEVKLQGCIANATGKVVRKAIVTI